MPIDKQDRIDLKVGALVRYTLSTEGWIELEKIFKQRLKELEAEVIRTYTVARRLEEKPLAVEDYKEMVSEEKGALMGLRLALDIPRAIVANADDILAKIPAAEQDEAMKDQR